MGDFRSHYEIVERDLRVAVGIEGQQVGSMSSGEITLAFKEERRVFPHMLACEGALGLTRPFGPPLAGDRSPCRFWMTDISLARFDSVLSTQ